MEQNNNVEQKRQFPFFTVLLCAFLIIILIISFWPRTDNKKITQSDFDQAISEQIVAGVYFYGDTVRGVYTEASGKNEVSLEDFIAQNGGVYDFYFTVNVSDDIATIKETIRTYNESNGEGVDIWYDGQQQGESWISQIWPFIYIALIIAIAVFIFRAFNKMSGKNMDFGRNKARVETNLKVRFKDVAGCEEEKVEMQEIVEFLKNPKKFTDLGARIPKGVLMVGPPGTGKTLLGKAIAGEAGVPFFSITGSDFVEMFVGVGAARVRDLFETAKKNSPCLIFIDEIDAVGRQRGTGLGNTNDEREQTLNQLLVQMDGFESSEGIIVIAATNRPDVLDPALLRAGRFDRRITVGYPDVSAREKILRLYTKDKPMASNINYAGIARHLGPGTTGADIENIINEAAILAARDERSIITQNDIMEGIVKTAMGPQKRSHVVSEEDKKNTAYHEAGHAIVSRTRKNVELKVHEVSIVPRGVSGGYTMPSPEKDLTQYTKEQLIDQIDVAMGGRAAELIIYNRVATGASNDIKQATNLARKMVTEFGMSARLGSVCYSGGEELFLGRDFQAHNNFSEKTAEIIDAEVKTIIDNSLKSAIDTLEKHRKELETMVEVLMEKETIYSTEVDMILAGKSAKEVIDSINEREKQKEEENKQAREAKIAKDEQERKEKEERERILRETAMMAFNNANIEEVQKPKQEVASKKSSEKQSYDAKEVKAQSTEVHSTEVQDENTANVGEKTIIKEEAKKKPSKAKNKQTKNDE